MTEETIHVKVVQEWELIKELFGKIPMTGNQINIIVFGPVMDLKKEISELKEALRGAVTGKEDQEKTKETIRSARSEAARKMWETRRANAMQATGTK